MAEDESAQDKSLEPSAKRRQDFRKRGEIAKSQEVSSALVITAGVAILLLSLDRALRGFSAVFTGCFSLVAASDVGGFDYEELLGVIVPHLGNILLVPLCSLWALTLVMGLIQSQGVIPEEPIKIDWNRLDPFANSKKLYFSSQPLMEGAKGVAKLVILLWLCAYALKPFLADLPHLVYGSAGGVLAAQKDLAMAIISRVIPFALIIALFDFVYQWYQLEQKMMMSPQEMKDEHKESEGDPHFRAQRRQRQREIAFSQNLRDVATADVIVTNPTHFAVALRYRKSEAPAPIVICKGVDHLAERIKAEARRHDVPQVENRLVARALYAQCKVGDMIPEELYAAVAQVLALVFRRRKARQMAR